MKILSLLNKTKGKISGELSIVKMVKNFRNLQRLSLDKEVDAKTRFMLEHTCENVINLCSSSDATGEDSA